MIENIQQARRLTKKYKISVEDIILIVLNCLGVNADILEKRIRFKLRLQNTNQLFYIAICVNNSKSPFFLWGDKLFLKDKFIGTASEIENDTCDSTYFRRNKTALTLNSNSRSQCRGCKFCGTYNLDPNDLSNLTTEDGLTKYLKSFLHQNKMKDLSNLVDVGICTGCFKDERDTLEHILMVREILKKFRFNKELKYLGSQIISEEALGILEKHAMPFSLYFTVECFTRRRKLLHPVKTNITISKIKKILCSALKRNFNTNILYILGLDSIGDVINGIRELKPYLTHFPIINVFQNYLPEQEALRIPEARQIEYYLEARKQIEKIFIKSNLRPRLWENYRGLWYFRFADKELKGVKI